MSLNVTFVNVKGLTKKKKHYILYKYRYFLKKIGINCVHISALKTIKTMMIARNNLIE